MTEHLHEHVGSGRGEGGGALSPTEDGGGDGALGLINRRRGVTGLLLTGGDDASGGGGEAAVEVGGGEAAVEVKPLMKLTISVFAAPLWGG